MAKFIFTGFSPNISLRSTLQSLSWLFFFWKWPYLRTGSNNRKLKKLLKRKTNTRNSFLFDSGRSALYFALKSLGLGSGDEVILQAYTCVVVTNAIKWTGAKPVYVDIGDSFNMDPADLRKKITKKTKAVIIQHTFGTPADLEKILEICNEQNLYTIEDCAHSIGAKYQKQQTGSFADIGMFSFGSDKVISSIRGGALVTQNNNITKKLEKYENDLEKISYGELIQLLLHYPIFFLGRMFYGIGVGKWFLYLSKKLHLTNLVIYKKEKSGNQVKFYPKKMANSIASFVCFELEKLDDLNDHRKSIAEIYRKEIQSGKIIHPQKDPNSIYLRYTILVENPKKLFLAAKKNKIMLGNWYDTVIAPGDIDMGKTGYKKSSCKHAEKLSSESLNLPTNRNITTSDAKRVANFINKYA